MRGFSGRSSERTPWRLLLMLAAVGVLSCDGLEDLIDPPPGKTCYEDSDCVPNGCCGEATTAIHRDDAPACGGVTCSGTCPTAQVQCGCGVPVCKDQRCS